MSVVEHVDVSRRRFLGGLVSTGAFVLAARVLPPPAWAQDPSFVSRTAATAFHPSVYLGIEPDGTVFIIAHRSEMGTGIRTSLPMIAADELEADWNRVRIEQAIGDPKYGDQNTDGSRSMRDFYQVFRVAGATARTMLIAAAAAQWGVPSATCRATNHEVVHTATGRRLGYGALAAAASALEVPKPEALAFKPASEWKYIGKTHAPYDLVPIVTGAAQFGHDIVRDGMVYASIEHPPVLGGTARSVDDSETRAVKGVQEIARLDTFAPPYRFKPLGGVAVIGASTWAVLQGRRKLKVAWDDGPHAGHDSVTFAQELRETVSRPCKVVRDLGDVDAEFAKGGRIVEAMYSTPMAPHAPMEPPVAVAEFVDGKVTVWAPTQNPQAVQDTVAQAVGIDKKDVTCHVTLLGGGFGRKSKPDYCAEAAVLAKRLGKPVKVVWTREDDLKFDYFHTQAAVYHKASLDARGRPTAWLARSAFPPLGGMSDPAARFAGRGEISQGLADLPFDVPNIRAENGPAEGHVRIGWFRAVANNQHAFAAHSFADELAHAAGRDPLEYLLDLLGPGKVLDLSTQAPMYGNYGANVALHPIDTRRLRRVLELAAERGRWGTRKPGDGWGAGIAAHRSFNSYVASYVEVEVDGKGNVRIPRVEMVADAGTIVNPDRVRAQFESAAVMGTGLALYGRITAARGRIVQSNFHDFQVARMNTAPVQTGVTLIDSQAPPTGIGEPGTPPVLPAVANAVFAATGKRVRSWPIVAGLA